MKGSVEQVRWRTGLIGCLFPFLAMATLLFAVAAFRPELVAELATERRGGWLEWTSAVTVAGINLPLALLALYLAWETFRFGWRWADEVALTAGTAGLVAHRSLLMRRIAWDELRDIRFVQLGRAPSLLIELRDGRSRAIRGVDNEDGAAERFAAAVRSRMEGDRG